MAKETPIFLYESEVSDSVAHAPAELHHRIEHTAFLLGRPTVGEINRSFVQAFPIRHIAGNKCQRLMVVFRIVRMIHACHHLIQHGSQIDGGQILSLNSFQELVDLFPDFHNHDTWQHA